VPAAGLVAAMIRLPHVFGPLERTISIFALSAVGAGAFLIGRAHARRRRERRNPPPPPGP